MKNICFFALLIASLSFTSCTMGVPQGPPEPIVEIIPAAPSPSHVWVSGYYGYRGNRYVWSPGFYSVPPRGRTIWYKGSYFQNRKGYHVYKRGYWK